MARYRIPTWFLVVLLLFVGWSLYLFASKVREGFATAKAKSKPSTPTLNSKQVSIDQAKVGPVVKGQGGKIPDLPYCEKLEKDGTCFKGGKCPTGKKCQKKDCLRNFRALTCTALQPICTPPDNSEQVQESGNIISFECANGYHGVPFTCNKTTNTFTPTPSCKMCKRPPKSLERDIMITTDYGNIGAPYKFSISCDGTLQSTNKKFTCDNTTGKWLENPDDPDSEYSDEAVCNSNTLQFSNAKIMMSKIVKGNG